MGLEFLVRVRRSTLWLAAVASLVIGSYSGPAHGLAAALGAAWSLVNLFLIEKLVVAVTGPDRNEFTALRRALASIGGMLGLIAAGAFTLTRLSPIFWIIGFSLPFAVMIMKAAALSILPTRLWRRLTQSPWRASLVVGIVVAGAWLATTGWSAGKTGSGAPRHTMTLAAAQETGPKHGPGETSHSSSEKGPEKFPNVITVLDRAFPDAPWARFLHEFEVIVFSLFVALLLCIVSFLATRNPQMIPGPLQNGVELFVEKAQEFVVGILGPKHGPRYLPFVGSLFIYILAMNLFGLIPFMDSPTSSLNVTVALALVVFVYAKFIGFKELGFVGYLDHMAGSPRDMIGWLLVPLMLPIHLMGELAKPISLSCRLFGNIFGEDMLLVAFASLGVITLAATHLPFGIPWQLPFLFLALLTSTLQALVFSVLSTIYFLLMLPHDDHAHEAEVQHAH